MGLTMLFVNFLPDVLKELVKHVPTLMFELIDWTELGKEVPKMTSRIFKKEGFDDFFQNQKEFLSKSGISISNSPFSSAKTAIPSQKLGEDILKIYFAQIYSPHGLALDLRIHHMESSNEGNVFHPTTLWTKVDPAFQLGLIHMYRGFYLQDDSQLELGLVETGLLKPYWENETKEELKQLLKSHFGNSLEQDMIFRLDHFNASFLKLARFLIANKVKISHDFMYLGIYLVSLYIGLETIKTPLPVSRIFKEIDDQFQGTAVRNLTI